MALLTVLLSIALLLILIIKKINPMLALLIVSVITGFLLGMPVTKVMSSISLGIGSTLGGMIMVLTLGAMLGKLIEDTGISKAIVYKLIAVFGLRGIQWAVLLTGFLVGIPLFYNAGFVVLIPLVFALASATNLPKIYVGLPMAAALSVTHGYLPPHPGPIAVAAIFKADVGLTLLQGLIISAPIAVIAGIVFPRLIIKLPHNSTLTSALIVEDGVTIPPAWRSFILALLPVFLIVLGTIGLNILNLSRLQTVFDLMADPTIALLVSVLITIWAQRIPLTEAMNSCTEGAKSIVMIILIIAAGGAFKQILIDSGIGEQVKDAAQTFHLSPIFLAWFITALLRVTLGSATVSALTGAAIVLPLVGPEAPPELMVLSVGAGSLMLSHVNDTGFWMFKEYFNLTLKQTLSTWTIMESIVSILGLVGVLILNAIT